MDQDREVTCLVLPDVDPGPLSALGAKIARGDITHKESLRGAFKGIDTVFHCAGLIHPKWVRELYQINTRGTENVLQAACEEGVSKLVYVSSNSPAGFGRSGDRIMKEDDPPRPYKHYGKSKRQAEEILLAVSREGRIAATIIRPCWFYGTGQPDRQTRFFRMIKKGRPILFGDGSNLRSMSYIDNVVQGLLLAERKDDANGKIYWIADKRPYSTIEIYETVADLLGVQDFRPRRIPAFSSWIFEQLDGMIQAVGCYQTEVHVAGEMAKDIACSIDKAERELGYVPGLSLREGMQRSLDWCRDQGIEI